MHPKGGGRGAGLASAHDAKSAGRPHAAFTRVQSGCAPVAPSQITHSLPRRAIIYMIYIVILLPLPELSRSTRVFGRMSIRCDAAGDRDETGEATKLPE